MDTLIPSGLDAPQDSPALRQEKQKDYRNVVLLQICMMSVALLAGDLLTLLGVAHAEVWTWVLYQILAGGYLYLLWDMLRNFTRRRVILFGVLSLEIVIFLGAVILNNFFHDIAHIDQINASLHVALCSVEVLTIYVAMRDMFQGPLQTVDKLWASGAIYFLSGFAFANIFNAVQLLDHGAYGTLGPVDHTAYFEGLYLSFTSLSGADNMYVNRSHLIRNLCVLECTFGQLYLVLLISRVLLPNEEVKA